MYIILLGACTVRTSRNNKHGNNNVGCVAVFDSYENDLNILKYR